MWDYHYYISTACQHSQHAECRQECKFCKNKCQCLCHTTTREVKDGR